MDRNLWFVFLCRIWKIIDRKKIKTFQVKSHNYCVHGLSCVSKDQINTTEALDSGGGSDQQL